MRFATSIFLGHSTCSLSCGATPCLPGVILPIRGFLFTLMDSPFGVVAIQLLDGVAAGIFGVISIIIAADLMRGTGRFNFAQGLVALSTGLGAGASNLLSGLCGTDLRLHCRFFHLGSDCSQRTRLFCFVHARNQAGGKSAFRAATRRYFHSEACLRLKLDLIYRPEVYFVHRSLYPKPAGILRGLE